MTRLHRSPRRSAAARGATLALSLLLAACGDNSTGPAPRKPVDPLATAANIQDLAETFSVPVFQSLGLASQYSPAGTSAFGTLRTVLRAAPPRSAPATSPQLPNAGSPHRRYARRSSRQADLFPRRSSRPKSSGRLSNGTQSDSGA